MNESSRPIPPPEAALIAAATKRSGMSARKAATRAGISDARWRQIVNGYQSVSGTNTPVRAPADRLARMAQVVGVTAPQLRDAGREDAAAELEELEAAEPPSASSPAGAYSPPLDAVTAIMAALPPEAQEEVIRRLGYTSPPSPTQQHPSGRQHRQAM